MQPLQSVIKIPQKQLDKLLNSTKEYYGEQETIYYANEVTKLHLNGGKDMRILIITAGEIFFFKTHFGKVELSMKFNILELEKISYIESSKITTASFKERPITVQSDDALLISNLLLTIFEICTYNVTAVPEVVIESTPPKALVKPVFQNRYPGSLSIRLLVLCHFYNQQFPLQCLQLIKEWDEKCNANFHIGSNFAPGNAAKAIGQAIAWDSGIKCFVLDNFAPGQLQLILQTLFSQSPFLTRLSIDNYKTPPMNPFNLPAPENTKIIEMAFRSSHSAVVFTVLGGLEKFAGRITTLTLSRIKLTPENFTNLYSLIHKFACFMNLKTLRLEDGSSDNVNLQEFAEYLSSSRLKSLSMSRSTTDISAVVSNIFPTLASVKSLSMIAGRLFDSMTMTDFVIPSCLTLLDISRTQIYPAALNSFLKALFSKPRKELLTLVMNDLASSVSSKEITDSFIFDGTQSLLAEFSYAGNELTPEDTKTMLSFLKTQKNLSYLNLSRCFKENIEESLSIVSGFIIETQLKGIEIGSDSTTAPKEKMLGFIESLTGKSQLSILNIEKSMMGDAGLQALQKFVTSNSKLTSINCDGIQPKSPELLHNAYETFVKVDRVQPPRLDIAFFKGKVKLPPQMQNKLAPLPQLQRIVSYENMNADVSQQIQPMDALVGLMTYMTQALTGKVKSDLFEKEDFVTIFRDSILTSTVALKNRDKVTPLDNLMNPQSKSGDVDEDELTTYVTMHF